MIVDRVLSIGRVTYSGPLGGTVEAAFRNILGASARLEGVPPIADADSGAECSTISGLVSHVLASEQSMCFYCRSISDCQQSADGRNGGDSRGAAVGLEFVANGHSNCHVLAIAKGRDGFREPMLEARATADKIDAIFCRGGRGEREAAELIGAPFSTCLSDAVGFDGDFSEFCSIVFAVFGLKAQIIPRAQRCGDDAAAAAMMGGRRSVVGGGSIKNAIVNFKCPETDECCSLLLSLGRLSECGELGRKIRNGLY